jgi:hypothetical protein
MRITNIYVQTRAPRAHGPRAAKGMRSSHECSSRASEKVLRYLYIFSAQLGRARPHGLRSTRAIHVIANFGKPLRIPYNEMLLLQITRSLHSA